MISSEINEKSVKNLSKLDNPNLDRNWRLQKKKKIDQKRPRKRS